MSQGSKEQTVSASYVAAYPGDRSVGIPPSVQVVSITTDAADFFEAVDREEFDAAMVGFLTHWCGDAQVRTAHDYEVLCRGELEAEEDADQAAADADQLRDDQMFDAKSLFRDEVTSPTRPEAPQPMAELVGLLADEETPRPSLALEQAANRRLTADDTVVDDDNLVVWVPAAWCAEEPVGASVATDGHDPRVFHIINGFAATGFSFVDYGEEVGAGSAAVCELWFARNGSTGRDFDDGDQS
jgi:hypothetical protein